MRRLDSSNVISNYPAIWVIGLCGRRRVVLDVNCTKQPKSTVEGSKAMAEATRPAKQVEYSVRSLGLDVGKQARFAVGPTTPGSLHLWTSVPHLIGWYS
jgi:hypothetical protein